MNRVWYLICLAAVVLVAPSLVFAAEETAAAASGAGLVALSAAITMSVAAFAGTTAQGKAVIAALETIGRNPAAANNVLIPMLLGLAFIESLVVLAFVIAIRMA